MDGPIAWSPDNLALAYIQLEFGCPFSGKSYLAHIDLATGEQTLLLVSEMPTFGNVTWEFPGQLLLFDANKTRWSYDLAAGSLEETP
jgi:hypothetical protein